MWELDHKEGWALKNWCFQTLVLEKTLESPLDCKEIKPVSPKGNQPWNSMEGLILNLKRQFFGHLMWRAVNGKDPQAGKDWRQEEKRQERMRWLDGSTDSVDMKLSKLWETEDRAAWHAAVHGSQRVRHSWATEQRLSSATVQLAPGWQPSHGDHQPDFSSSMWISYMIIP